MRIPNHSQSHIITNHGKVADWTRAWELFNTTSFVHTTLPIMEFYHSLKYGHNLLESNCKTIQKEWYQKSEKYRQYYYYELLDLYNYMHNDWWGLSFQTRISMNLEYSQVEQSARYYLLDQLGDIFYNGSIFKSLGYTGNLPEVEDMFRLSEINKFNYFDSRDLEDSLTRPAYKDFLLADLSILDLAAMRGEIDNLKGKGVKMAIFCDNPKAHKVLPDFHLEDYQQGVFLTNY